MDSQYRPSQLAKALPAQPISTGPSNHTQSQSPFRYLNQRLEDLSEKGDTPLTDVSSRHTPAHRISRSTSRAATPIPFARQSPQCRSRAPTPLLIPAPTAPTVLDRVKPWIPLILYGISSLGFVIAIAFWKSEVFQGTHENPSCDFTILTVLQAWTICPTNCKRMDTLVMQSCFS